MRCVLAGALAKAVLATAAFLCLASCGGGGGAGSGGTATSAVSGMAAAGSGIAGRVSIKDASGQERFVDTASGSFTLNVDGLTPPFLLKAQWTVSGVTQTLYGFASGSGTANVTPLTNLAVVAAAGSLSLDAVYQAPSPAAYNAIAAGLPAAVQELRSALAPLLSQFSVSGLDLLTGAFAADHTGMDALLDSITVQVAGGESVVSDAASGATLFDAPSTDLGHALTMPAWTAQDAAVANDPDIAVDANGNALVVWANSVSAGNSIQARFISQANGTTVTLNTSGLCITPKVAFDGGGNAVIAWVQDDNGRSAIWTRRYAAAGSTWGIPVQISAANAPADAAAPDVAVDAAGNAVVVWTQGNGQVNDYDVWYAAYSSTAATWSSPVLVSDGVNSSYGVRVAVDANGEGIVAWQQEQGNGSVSNAPTDVWARRFSTTGAWGMAVRINTVPAAQAAVYGQIAVAMDSDGNGAALWVQGSIQAAMLVASGGWQPSQAIMSVPANLAYGPHLAFDAAGNAVAVWQEQDGVTAFGGANRFLRGAGWGTSVSFTDPAAGDVYLPRVAIDGAGNATAVWYQVAPGSNAQVYTSRNPAGGSWGVPHTLSPTSTDGFAVYPVPVAAANAAGHAVAAWGVDSN